jgi:ABC-type uncharacterized transport system substrate-binding protein
MIRNKILCAAMIAVVSAFLLCPHALSKDKGRYKTTPTTNQGAKWRVGYLEGGPYSNYQESLKATVEALMELGWVEQEAIPALPDSEDTRELWKWLSTTAKSDYIQFVSDAYWSSDWKKDVRRQNKEKAVKRLTTVKDIDLMIVLGTWAGQDLVKGTQSVPLVVMSVSDPVKAGIIKSPKDSGQDNVHAWSDPTRSTRRLKLFHDILGFKKLGIIYEDTETGRTYAYLDDTKRVAKERGFQVMECHADEETGISLDECARGVYSCIEKLAPEVDAYVLTDHRGQHPKFLPKILEPMFKHKVLVFAKVRGLMLVKRGAVMGIARVDFSPLGKFYASVIAKIFNGARPRDLDQIYKEPLELAVNLEAAQRIEYKIPKNVLAIAGLVYKKIDSQPMK